MGVAEWVRGGNSYEIRRRQRSRDRMPLSRACIDKSLEVAGVATRGAIVGAAAVGVVLSAAKGVNYLGEPIERTFGIDSGCGDDKVVVMANDGLGDSLDLFCHGSDTLPPVAKIVPKDSTDADMVVTIQTSRFEHAGYFFGEPQPDATVGFVKFPEGWNIVDPIIYKNQNIS